MPMPESATETMLPSRVGARGPGARAPRGRAAPGGLMLRLLERDQIDDVIERLVGVLALLGETRVGGAPLRPQLLPAGADLVRDRRRRFLDLLSDDAIGHRALAVQTVIDVVPLVGE